MEDLSLVGQRIVFRRMLQLVQLQHCPSELPRPLDFVLDQLLLQVLVAEKLLIFEMLLFESSVFVLLGHQRMRNGQLFETLFLV